MNDVCQSDIVLTFVFSKVCHLIINRLIIEQRFQIVEIYFLNRSFVFYGRNNRPEQAIRSVMDKFRTTHSLYDVRPLSIQRNVRTEEAIRSLKASIY